MFLNLRIPCCCLVRGHLKSRELREKLENLKLQHPAHLPLDLGGS